LFCLCSRQNFLLARFCCTMARAVTDRAVTSSSLNHATVLSTRHSTTTWLAVSNTGRVPPFCFLTLLGAWYASGRVNDAFGAVSPWMPDPDSWDDAVCLKRSSTSYLFSTTEHYHPFPYLSKTVAAHTLFASNTSLSPHLPTAASSVSFAGASFHLPHTAFLPPTLPAPRLPPTTQATFPAAPQPRL